MPTTVNMPQLGETVTEGTILQWSKQVGDAIAADDVLVEISTDKVDTEVPSPVSGTILEILVPEGDTVEVGTPLVIIGEAGDESAIERDAEAVSAAEPEPVAELAPATEPEPRPVAAAPAVSMPAASAAGPLSPVVRRLVHEHGLDPAAIAGTGRDGRITRRDVEAHVAAAPAATAPEAPSRPAAGHRLSPVVRKLVAEHDLDVDDLVGTGPGGRITRRDVEQHLAQPTAVAKPAPFAEPAPAVEPAPPAPTVPAPAASAPAPAAPAAGVPSLEGDDVRDLSRLRVRIGENMVRAKQTAAHVWTSVEVDYERLERVRQQHKAAFKQSEGFGLTYLPFVGRATIDALRAFPVVNSEFHLEQKKAVFHRTVNLGVAIDVDQQGLVVGTVRGADGLRLVGIARQIRGLAERARSGKLTPDDVTGSTFTISNPGPFGSFMTAPIINVPNTGILSTDTVVKRPVVVQDDSGADVIAIRRIGYLGLTWDHRAFDGSTAVLFLRRIKDNIENWDWAQELT